MSNSNNLLIVTSEFPPQPGGIGNHAYGLAKQLQQHQFNVHVISDQRSSSGLEEKAFDVKNNFLISRVKRSRFRPEMYIKRVLIVFDSVKKSNIIIASGRFSLWTVAFCSLFFHRKTIAVIHGTEANFKNKILKYSIDKALHRFQYIIAVSNYTKSLIGDLRLRNISVIPNGFDTKKFTGSAEKPFQLRGNPKLLTIGNVTERKGQLNVIKLLPQVLKHFPHIHYHCVGIPTEKAEFLKVACQLKVQNQVTFHDRASDSELSQFLSTSDIFVMLSGATQSGDVEGFGIALIEANAIGLPTIGSKGCGIEDAISNHKSGILISHTNAAEFVEAIKSILNSYDIYRKHAKNWAKSHEWSNVIKQYIKVIEG